MFVNKVDLELRERAARVIPNGMYGHQSTAIMPEDFPQFFSRAEGTRLWDVDGNEYVDFMGAYGPNLLGYDHPAIRRAISDQMELGDTMTGPTPLIVELAETMVSMISHADWAMFCKNGSDATSMALVTARAYKNRRKILVAKKAYHGSQTWCTPKPAGILPEDRAHIVYFDYNDVESLRDAVRQTEGDLAGIFATPFRHNAFHNQSPPDAEFARAARTICDEHDALLIIDDIRAGFRLSRDCSWSTIGIEPDLSCWGKVLGNGQPISALLGSEKARKAAGSIFVTGSFWFSAVPMAAAIAVLHEIRNSNYLEHIEAIGEQFRHGIQLQATEYDFEVHQTGPVTLPMILFGNDPEYKTGYEWCRVAMKHGAYLSPYHNMFINAAMTKTDIEQALTATDAAFKEIAQQRKNTGRHDNFQREGT